MGEGGSLINLGDLSKPATVLIEKISDAIGALYKPSQIKRVAHAEAEAEKIRALAGLEISEIQQRALERLVAEEGKKQENIEKITANATTQLNPDAKPEEMDPDWISHFFDKCRIVSNEEMQSLWSNLLAGEANKPGSYSKRTVDLVSTLDKSDAQLFTQLCTFAISGGDTFPIILDHNNEFYTKKGITFGTLNHLKDRGVRLDKWVITHRISPCPESPAFIFPAPSTTSCYVAITARMSFPTKRTAAGSTFSCRKAQYGSSTASMPFA